MMQAEDDSSELDDDDFLGGLSPDDESTPLNRSRGKSLLIKPSEDSPSRSESPLSSPEGSRKRKRMTQEIQVPQSPIQSHINVVKDTPTATPIQLDGSLTREAEEAEAEVPEQDVEEEEEEVERVEDTQQSQQYPEIFSQTMLPPTSSPMRSPAGSATVTGDSTPTASQPAARKKSKAPTHLSTASLQDKLLPRRRRRKNRAGDDFDVPSDESDDQHDAASGDEDELSYPSRRPSRRKASSRKPKPLANAQDKSRVNNPRQWNAKEKPAKSKAARKAPTTYSRSRGSIGVEKENEMLALSSPSSSPLSSPPDSDVSDNESAGTEPTPRCVSDELRAAVKKFAEVDQWKMEFEDVSASETLGSPSR
jgi:hypothetical protein